MAKKNRRGGGLARLASQEADVRYGPELSALQMLAGDIEGRYAGDVQTARGAAAGVQRGIKGAAPDLRRAYEAGSGLASRGRAFSDPVLASVPRGGGGLTDLILSEIGREREGHQNRLSGGLVDALEGLADRSVQAAEGRAHALTSARGRRDDDLGKVQQRGLDLARERGTFAQSRVGTLREERADRRLERQALNATIADRNADNARQDASLGETQRHNRAMERGGGGKGGSPLTRGQKNELRAELDEALHWTKVMRKPGKNGQLSYDKVAALLVEGRDKDALGEGSPKVPKIKHRAIVDAAIQIERDGAVKPATAKRLRQLGIGVPAKFRPKPPLPKRQQRAGEELMDRALGALFPR